MSKLDFDIEDMALEGKERSGELPDMSLDGSSSGDLESRIKKLFPGEDKINITIDNEIHTLEKSAAGNYLFQMNRLKDLDAETRRKIDQFLTQREKG